MSKESLFLVMSSGKIFFPRISNAVSARSSVMFNGGIVNFMPSFEFALFIALMSLLTFQFAIV